MLRFWNTIAGDHLPACVKYAVTRQGAPGGLPRAPMPAPTDAQTAAIDQALAAVLAFEPAPVARAAE
jgi:4-hydroxy-tetrahydrodipicolinate synthase